MLVNVILVWAVVYLVIYLVRAWVMRSRRVVPFTGLFNGNYVDSRSFYMYRYGSVPCITLVNEIDVNQASEYIRERYAAELQGIYQHNHYNHAANEVQFNVTIFVMSNGRMIEFGSGYAEVLHGYNQYAFAAEVATALAAFRVVVEVPVIEGFCHIPVAGFMREERQFDNLTI